jgi:hypothetical protein
MNAYHCAYDAGAMHAPFPWPKKVFASAAKYTVPAAR